MKRIGIAGLLLAAVLMLSAFPGSAHEGHLPVGFGVSTYLDGLNQPVAVEFAADGRIFIAEKPGILRAFDGPDAPGEVVIDLTTKVHDLLDRGFLGLALHPDFPATNWVYLLYTYDAPPGQAAPRWGTGCPSPPGGTEDGCVVTGRLSRIRVNRSNELVGTEQVLIRNWCQQFPSHSIGDLAFGVDGALYVSAGEGANFSAVDTGQYGGSPASPTPVNPCGDPPGEGGALRAQDILTSDDPVGLSGTVLRLDPDTGAALGSNPLIGGNAADDRIIAHGLRNPYRMAVRPGTDEVWVADVGWGSREELNRIVDPIDTTVENFGWPCYEGEIEQWGYRAVAFCKDLYAGEYDTSITFPYLHYRHDGTPFDAGCGGGDQASISGLAFYGGGDYPAAYDGALFFADFSKECIWLMAPGADGLPDPQKVSAFLDEVAPVELDTGPGGDIFFVEFGVNGAGAVRRIEHLGSNEAPVAVIAADVTAGPAPLTVRFDATASVDPDGDPLTFSWDLDGDGTFETGNEPRPTRTYPAGTYKARLRVRDDQGAADEAYVMINSGNDPPRAQITSPAAGTTWSVGDRIAFAGSGSDPEDGALRRSSMSWTVLLHHCYGPDDCHAHVVSTFGGVRAGTFSAPDHEYPSFLEVQLTVTDSDGATHTASRELRPEPVVMRFETHPPGLRLVVAGKPQTAPFEHTAIVGSVISVTAPERQRFPGSTWKFESWSHGAGAIHEITAPPGAATYRASYSPRDLDLATQTILFDPAAGEWHVRYAPEFEDSFFYGIPGDVPLMGDWDCDGIATVGMYRPSSGFVYLRNANTFGVADIELWFGLAGDEPLVGDWNGDACDTLGIYRQGRVHLRNTLDTGFADVTYDFGMPGDRPFTGDFDGDGRATVGLYREATGFVYFRNTPTTGVAEFDFYYGAPSDRIIAGDWDGDGVDTVGIFRPAEARFYLSNRNEQGTADTWFDFGKWSWVPVAGRIVG